jgi:hypothetical protein
MALQERALLEEYREILDFLLSESRIAWELVSIYMVVQAGLGSIFAILLSRNSNVMFPVNSFVFLIGFLSSLLWVSMMYRSRLRRKHWLYAGWRLERQLRDRGLALDVFEMEYRVSERKLALEFFENEIRWRNQEWYERIGALRAAHYIMIGLTIFWLFLLLVSLPYSMILK